MHSFCSSLENTAKACGAYITVYSISVNKMYAIIVGCGLVRRKHVFKSE